MHRMIEQSSVHLPGLVKDIGQPVSIYLVHLSRYSSPVSSTIRAELRSSIDVLVLKPATRTLRPSKSTLPLFWAASFASS